MARLKIEYRSPRDQRVELDGTDISNGISDIRFHAEAGQVPMAYIDLPVLDATEIQAEQVKIIMPDATRELLLAAGWTPPGAGDGITPIPPPARIVTAALADWLLVTVGVAPSALEYPGHFLARRTDHGYEAQLVRR